MGIDLGGRNAFVPQHFLHGPQVCAAFYQVGGKGMAQGMRRYVFSDAGFFYQVFQQQEDHYPAQFAAAAVQEKNVVVARLYGNVYAYILPVDVNVFDGAAANGYQSFFIALAQYFYKAQVKVEIRYFKVYQLTHPQAAAVQGFQDGFVSAAFGFAEINLRNNGFNFFKGERVWQRSFQFGCFQQYRGVFFADVLQ